MLALEMRCAGNAMHIPSLGFATLIALVALEPV